ncbi:MAG: hypothetical protein ACR2OG_13450 [Gemmatimonadaceae bacterium]
MPTDDRSSQLQPADHLAAAAHSALQQHFLFPNADPSDLYLALCALVADLRKRGVQPDDVQETATQLIEAALPPEVIKPEQRVFVERAVKWCIQSYYESSPTGEQPRLGE